MLAKEQELREAIEKLISDDDLGSFKYEYEENPVLIRELKFSGKFANRGLLHFAMDSYAHNIVEYLIQMQFPLDFNDIPHCNPFYHLVSMYVDEKSIYERDRKDGHHRKLKNSNHQSKNEEQKSKMHKCLETIKVLLKSDIEKDTESCFNPLTFLLSSSLSPVNKIKHYSLDDADTSKIEDVLTEIEDVLILFLKNGFALEENLKIKILYSSLCKAIKPFFDKDVKIPQISKFHNEEAIRNFALVWKNHVNKVESELKSDDTKVKEKYFALLDEAKGYLNIQNIFAPHSEAIGIIKSHVQKRNNVDSLMSMSVKTIIMESLKHGPYFYISELAKLKFDEELHQLSSSEMHELEPDKQLYMCIGNGTLLLKLYQSLNKEDGKLTKDDDNILNISALFVGLISCHEIIKLIEEAYEKSKNLETNNKSSKGNFGTHVSALAQSKSSESSIDSSLSDTTLESFVYTKKANHM